MLTDSVATTLSPSQLLAKMSVKILSQCSAFINFQFLARFAHREQGIQAPL